MSLLRYKIANNYLIALLKSCKSLLFSIKMTVVRKNWNDKRDKQARERAHWCITKTKSNQYNKLKVFKSKETMKEMTNFMVFLVSIYTLKTKVAITKNWDPKKLS